MQTDTWLTETSYPERCPLCSQPLNTDSNKCPSCGFIAHEPARKDASSLPQPAQKPSARQPNPITPIPPRASAVRAQKHAPGSRSQYPLSPFPEGPSVEKTGGAGGWQHSSPTYEAASSLSSLSLIIAETPTAPPRPPRKSARLTENLPPVDEIDTQPPPMQEQTLSEESETPGTVSLRLDEIMNSERALMVSPSPSVAPLSHIDEIDTLPERKKPSTPSRALVPARRQPRHLAVDAASWTASSVPARAQTERALLSLAQGGKKGYPHGFHALDRLRWWLLRPGHIEFLLWLAGSVLLFGITFFLLLATVLSFTLPTSRGNLPGSATAGVSSPTRAVTPRTSSSRRLTLPGKSTLLPGSRLQLQGQGFQPHSEVVFLLDGRWPLHNQEGGAASIQADASGNFTANLWLGEGAEWSAGPHQLLARETQSGQQVTVPITIASGPVAGMTPVANDSGSTNTAPQSTPQPAQPTPTPVRPTATPETADTPTPSPTTVSATATAVKTPATPEAAATATVGTTSDLGNSLNNQNSDSLLNRVLHLNPLVWLIGSCYFLSMILLGIAGILRRHRPRRSHNEA